MGGTDTPACPLPGEVKRVARRSSSRSRWIQMTPRCRATIERVQFLRLSGVPAMVVSTTPGGLILGLNRTKHRDQR